MDPNLLQEDLDKALNREYQRKHYYKYRDKILAKRRKAYKKKLILRRKELKLAKTV